ncbi:ABC transporter ATP-binding protein [Paracoccus aerodenitrificans]|uniref:ABC transporter ATP-binding protein n=1 Tax=Paracoccus aerodenitrificans TaxID=3017781 RepID=UPI0022F0D800|nr:ABC transporter ATP-binding protein [Paracoccus aerodenitrificans]WBU65371.1 ABC transporter ATP-binding protein [Paracoccus aerodenitrificans]
MSEISFDRVSLRFDRTLAVDDVSVTLGSGRFVALLGPSGCGKTSLLRLIAGLVRPDEGSVTLGGQVVASDDRFVEPEQRDLGMVFQSYALWPHMTVAGNIGFGLNRLRRDEREDRVRDALRMVGMTQMAARKPHELSGGQRQRVALARSLAARPRILLLDEPLANLDAHLRQSMLGEFRRIHEATGCTMVFVTHDQNEAMAVADLVGVMDRGRLEQIGSPHDLFDRPATPMVARFVGQGRTLPVSVSGRSAEGFCRIVIGRDEVTIPGCVDRGPAWLCLHSRDLVPSADGLDGRIGSVRFEDGHYIADVMLDQLPEADSLPVRLNQPARQGDQIRIALRGGWVLPREGTAPVPVAERLRQGQAVPA